MSNDKFSGMALWLDQYDDIFSDFDSRDYDERTISDDFLNEVRKISREGDDAVSEFHLLMPELMRDLKKEEMIIKRLHAYFRKNLHQVESTVRQSRKRGIAFSIVGILILLLAGYITAIHAANLPGRMVVILCEPAAWFFIWMGYDHLANARARKKSELGFYSGLSKCRVSFHSLNEQRAALN